jgi:hypothetical protein
MKTLIIADIAHTDTLDAKSMASVRGGSGMPKGLYPLYMPAFSSVKNDLSFDATQLINQSQNVVNENGNNAAFVSGISSTVKPTQSANNKIDFF